MFVVEFWLVCGFFFFFFVVMGKQEREVFKEVFILLYHSHIGNKFTDRL